LKTKEENRGSSIKSLVKALHLLQLFTPKEPEWAFNDMESHLGFHKSSIQRLVTTLEAEGFLERTEPGKSRYRLGPQVLYLGNVAAQSIDLRRAARPALEGLVKATGETSHLCVVEQSQCYYLDKMDSPQSIRIVTYVGQRLNMHCTGVGKALLSGMSVEEVDRIIAERGLPKFTENTITDRDTLLKELSHIRHLGVSYDNEEFEIGLRCIAAPIFNHQGRVVAAISFSGPAQRLTSEVLAEYESNVCDAARQVSLNLGHQFTSDS
jgi:DNA-binding IclR family transcriptional regulator